MPLSAFRKPATWGMLFGSAAVATAAALAFAAGRWHRYFLPFFFVMTTVVLVGEGGLGSAPVSSCTLNLGPSSDAMSLVATASKTVGAAALAAQQQARSNAERASRIATLTTRAGAVSFQTFGKSAGWLLAAELCCMQTSSGTMSSGARMVFAFVAGILCCATTLMFVWPAITESLEICRTLAEVTEAKVARADAAAAQQEQRVEALTASLESERASVAAAAQQEQRIEVLTASLESALAASANATTPPPSCVGSAEVPLGVAKWELEAAKAGSTRPSPVDELSLAFADELSRVASRRIHRLGEPAAAGGGGAAAWEAALRSMRVGERAAFKLGEAEREAAEGLPRGADGLVEVTLEEITPMLDLSPSAARPLLKTTLRLPRPGAGPTDGARVEVGLAWAGEGATGGGARVNETLEFVLGEETEVGEGVRLGLLSSGRGETARLRMHPSLAPPARRPAASAAEAGLLEVEVELRSFREAKPVQAMSSSELLAHVGRLKRTANSLFSRGELESACEQYEQAGRVLRVMPEGIDAVEAALLSSLQQALMLNGAACSLKVGRHAAALAQSDSAIALAPGSAKAHFRRGQALRALGREAEAEAALVEALRLEPSSREAHEALDELRGGRDAGATAAAGPDWNL